MIHFYDFGLECIFSQSRKSAPRRRKEGRHIDEGWWARGVPADFTKSLVRFNTRVTPSLSPRPCWPHPCAVSSANCLRWRRAFRRKQVYCLLGTPRTSQLGWPRQPSLSIGIKPSAKSQPWAVGSSLTASGSRIVSDSPEETICLAILAAAASSRGASTAFEARALRGRRSTSSGGTPRGGLGASSRLLERREPLQHKETILCSSRELTADDTSTRSPRRARAALSLVELM